MPTIAPSTIRPLATSVRMPMVPARDRGSVRQGHCRHRADAQPRHRRGRIGPPDGSRFQLLRTRDPGRRSVGSSREFASEQHRWRWSAGRCDDHGRARTGSALGGLPLIAWSQPYQSARVSSQASTSARLNRGQRPCLLTPLPSSYSVGKPDGRAERRRSICRRDSLTICANSSTVIMTPSDARSSRCGCRAPVTACAA